MQRHLIGIALLAAATSLAGCSGPYSDVRPVMAMDGSRMELQDPVDQGRAQLVTGQYGLAVETLSRVLHDQPNNVRALTLIAETYDQLHRYDLADRYHAKALEIDPNSVAALNNWGYSYLVRGDKARAKDLLQRAQAVKGDQPVVLANLRLAGVAEPAASAEPAVTEPAIETIAEVPISVHISVVRRTSQLVRIAPGVQLLVTTTPMPQLAPVASAAANTVPSFVASSDVGLAVGPIENYVPRQSTVTAVPLPYLVAQAEPADADTRVRNLAALQRLLDPSPFGFFPDVDDFNAQPQMGVGSAAITGWSIGQAGYRLAG